MTFRNPRPSTRDTTPAVSARMRGVKSSWTKPEREVAAVLERAGFRVVRQPRICGISVDLAVDGFPVAIEVLGCFWHGCPSHFRPSGANVDYWRAKIQKTRLRDLRNARRLAASGFAVVHVWEHEIGGRFSARFVEKVRALVDGRRIAEPDLCRANRRKYGK